MVGFKLLCVCKKLAAATERLVAAVSFSKPP